jgi:phage tail-like protein
MANSSQFVVNAYRFDPYQNSNFHIRWGGKVVAGISKVTGLKQTTEVVSHREGGDPSTYRLTPSTWKPGPITLERGVTHDPDFENWAALVWNIGGNSLISLLNFRKDIVIELLNEQGVVAKAYNVYRCWVSEYQALPDLDANTHVVAIEHMIIQNEGWERDMSVPEPKQT